MISNQTPVGLLRLAKIIKYNKEHGYIECELDFTNNSIPNDAKTKRVQVPFAMYSTNGSFIGGYPTPGTPVIIGQGEGSQWYFVSFRVANTPQIPFMKEGDLLVQTASDTYAYLNTKNEIEIGSDLNNLYFNTIANKLINKTQNTFSNIFSFTEAGRHIDGIIKRETQSLINIPDFQKLINENYDEQLTPISLDPTFSTLISSNSKSKNPPFTEIREMIYEFAISSNVSNDINEATIYAGKNEPMTQYTLPNRRNSKVDTLSLSLVAPNYLMETTKGNVVDIFGNILDINRVPIPIGQTADISLKPNSSASDKSKVYNTIRALERNNIAFHFEINARKDLAAQNGQEVLPDITSNANYSRSRSRFFMDINKEGMIKLNIPASSETGNIPLLTRYENYSTFGSEDNGNPNKLIYRNDNLDIFLDSFALNGGDIIIQDSNSTAITPIDRILNQHIKHGTPFHSILKSLTTFQSSTASQWLDIQYNQVVDLNSITTYDNIVNPTITISGNNANAGGRSGSINFDGMIELSLGSNTIDRQSLWADFAGGIIANIGRDKNNISLGMSLDGDLLVQIGGNGVVGDSRFSSLNNSFRGGALDIRVMNQGFTVTIVRIDQNGVSIVSPSSINIVGRDIQINASGTLDLEGDNVIVQGRLVNRLPGTSI